MNVPVPNQLSGKIHVMLYLQILSADDSLGAQWDSNDKKKKNISLASSDRKMNINGENKLFGS